MIGKKILGSSMKTPYVCGGEKFSAFFMIVVVIEICFLDNLNLSINDVSSVAGKGGIHVVE